MSPPCNECSGGTVWDDDAGSAICTTCGTLVDSSQSVLTPGDNFMASSTTTTWNPLVANSSTLKSHRNSNWSLAGQGHNATTQQHANEMNVYIVALTKQMSEPNLAPRVATLFAQAMRAGNFRWGAKAKLVAGACLSIALRESRKSDFRHDIARLVDAKPSKLTRVLSAVLSCLELSLNSSDPSFYLPSLHAYLVEVLKGNSSNLPSSLVNVIKPLNMPLVLSSAHALSDLISRSALPSGPKASILGSAAAIFILALEGQARTTLTGLGELGALLALRCHIGKSVVMKRYKSIQDELAAVMSKIPWLEQYEQKQGRAKVAKRMLIARSLPDIIAWGSEKLRANFQPPTLFWEDKDKDGDSEPESLSSHNQSLRQTSRHRSLPPQKKQKLCHPLLEASKFLLDPLSSSLPSSPKLVRSSTSGSTRNLPMTTYLLAAPEFSLSSNRLPTRLQLLTVTKLGEEIHDDELFDDGELEGLLRSTSEVEMMRRVWDQNNPISEQPLPKQPHTRKRKRLDEPSNKVNRDALAQFMEDFAESTDPDGQSTAILGLAVSFNEDYDNNQEESDEEDNSQFSKIHRLMNRELKNNSAASYLDEYDGVDHTYY